MKGQPAPAIVTIDKAMKEEVVAEITILREEDLEEAETPPTASPTLVRAEETLVKVEETEGNSRGKGGVPTPQVVGSTTGGMIPATRKATATPGTPNKLIL